MPWPPQLQDVKGVSTDSRDDVALQDALDAAVDWVEDARAGDFDFAVNESCAQYGECEALTPFTASGKTVLHVEYDLDTAEFCPLTTRLGFLSIRKPLDLTAPVEPCPSGPSS